MPSRTSIAATIAAAALTAGAYSVATGDVLGSTTSLSGSAGVPRKPPIPAWRIAHSVRADEATIGFSDLQDAQAVGPNDVWAVGSVEDGGQDGGQGGGQGGRQNRRHAVAQHWDGRTWTSTPLPAPFQEAADPLGSSGLSLVRAVPGAVWAFGWAKGGRARYALSWNGRSWAVSHEWDAYGDFTGAVVTGATNVWAFDDQPGSTSTVGTWHFDGLTWTRSATPFHLIAAQALSRGDIWGTALVPRGDGLFRPTVTHWDGWKWREVPTPSLDSEPGAQAVLTAVTATSGSDVWAVGYQAHDGVFVPTALHWDGANWRRADPQGSGYGLYSVTPDGKGGVWAAEGDTYSGGAIHFIGGRWVPALLPRMGGKSVVVRTVSRVPGTSMIWAAGVLVQGHDLQTGGIVLSYS